MQLSVPALKTDMEEGPGWVKKIWPEAPKCDFRYTSESGLNSDIAPCPFGANERHWRHVVDCRPQNPTPTPPLPSALKALVAHRGALGAGIVADIVLRPPVEVDIDDAAMGFMR